MKQKSKPKVRCAKCDGSGETEIPDDLFSTMEAVRTLKCPTAWEVRELLNWTGADSAISNRLRLLVDHRLLTRSKLGGAFKYSISK